MRGTIRMVAMGMIGLSIGLLIKAAIMVVAL